jgi:hypothetical protein
VTNIEDDTLENKDFRRVLYTGKKFTAGLDEPSAERGDWLGNS